MRTCQEDGMNVWMNKMKWREKRWRRWKLERIIKAEVTVEKLWKGWRVERQLILMAYRKTYDIWKCVRQRSVEFLNKLLNTIFKNKVDIQSYTYGWVNLVSYAMKRKKWWSVSSSIVLCRERALQRACLLWEFWWRSINKVRKSYIVYLWT